jgi:hypothetical protein
LRGLPGRLWVFVFLMTGAFTAQAQTAGQSADTEDAEGSTKAPQEPDSEAAPLEKVPQAVQRMLDRYDAGDYRYVSRRGRAVLTQYPDSLALALAIGNSLAWTGRYAEAEVQYRRLYGTAQEVAARVAIGNMLRWRGMPDLAAEQYAEAQKIEPGSAVVREAEQLLARDIRPALTARVDYARDNIGQSQADLSFSWRQWLDGNAARIDVTALASHDERNGVTDPYREAQASVFLPDVALSPKVEIGQTGGIHSSTVGLAQVELPRDVFSVRAGRVDWGRLAFDSLALRDGLMANTAGASLNTELSGTRVRARYDIYAISGGNRLADADMEVTPVWQPIPGGLTWHVGGDYRKADRTDPRYWSPDTAYGVANLTLKRNWYWDDGEIGLTAQYGFKMTDSAGDGLSFSASARRWVSKNWAVIFEAVTNETPRPSAYRYQGIAVTVQRLW